MRILLFVLYVVVAVASARMFYVSGFKYDYQDSMAKRLSEERALTSANRFGLYLSWGGLIWPIMWPVIFIYSIITAPTPVEKDLAREKRIQQDIARLRIHFATLDMEPPDTATLRKIAEDRVNKDEDRDGM